LVRRRSLAWPAARGAGWEGDERGDDIYVFSAAEFFTLDLEDIEAKRNGWK